MKNILISNILILVVLSACGGDGSSSNQHHRSLNLGFSVDHPFDANISPGRIERYKITISGDALPNTIVREFDSNAGTVYFDDSTSGATMSVLVEALNSNSQVIGRGNTQVVIKEDAYTDAPVILNHVPIFTNVYEGSTVYANRFVPKIYAPAGMGFQVMESINGSLTALPDVVSGEVNFSVSEDAANISASQTIHTPQFSVGTHQLMVRDMATGESSTVNVNVMDTGNVALLPTTAGDYLGSAYSTSENQPTDVIRYFKNLVQ